MSQPAQQGDTRFLGFAADGSKMYADRCTYCLREGHRASHCPSRRPADFAALAERCTDCMEGQGRNCRCRDAAQGSDWVDSAIGIAQRVAGLIGAAVVLGLVLKVVQAGVQ